MTVVPIYPYRMHMYVCMYVCVHVVSPMVGINSFFTFPPFLDGINVLPHRKERTLVIVNLEGTLEGPNVLRRLKDLTTGHLYIGKNIP